MLAADTSDVMVAGVLGHAEIHQRMFKCPHGEVGAMRTLSMASPTSLSLSLCASYCYFLFAKCQLKQRVVLLGLCFPMEKITSGSFQKMLLKRTLYRLKTYGKKANVLMAFYYNKNWSESSLNFLPSSILLNKPLSVGGGLCLNNRSKDGEMVFLRALILRRSSPVTSPKYLTKLKMCFKSKSLLLVVAGRSYLQIQ